MQTNRMRALIRLVEDPDEIVYKHVRSKLLDCGASAIPHLESEWENYTLGVLFQQRVEQIIHDIQYTESLEKLEKWKHSFDKDLLAGCIIIAQYQYPGLEEEEVKQAIDEMEKVLWLEMSNRLTIMEKIRVLNKVFFQELGFSGNQHNFHNPLNSYINTVTEMRKGSPLLLSILYSILAQRVGLPIYGVNLPNHFIVALMDKEGLSHYRGEPNPYGVLFYINPYHRGSLFDENEIEQFLLKIKVPPERKHFEPCSNTDILRRMLANLIHAYIRQKKYNKVNELKGLRAILDAPLAEGEF